MNDVVTTPEHPLIETATDFAAQYIAPNAVTWELQGGLGEEGIRSAAKSGMWGMLLPKFLGGQGMSKTDMARALVELSKADMAYAFVLIVQNNLIQSFPI